MSYRSCCVSCLDLLHTCFIADAQYRALLGADKSTCLSALQYCILTLLDYLVHALRQPGFQEATLLHDHQDCWRCIMMTCLLTTCRCFLQCYTSLYKTTDIPLPESRKCRLSHSNLTTLHRCRHSPVLALKRVLSYAAGLAGCSCKQPCKSGRRCDPYFHAWRP